MSVPMNGRTKKEHSLVKPYQGTGMTIPSWDFSGSTMVTTSFIRITPDQQSRMGGLWNKINQKRLQYTVDALNSIN
ncbi:unnamed protein product [Oppiella nova]|uniref:L-type lectin-like domain-containing protein n=1 Tax=Oppiella nova TaxID=334625 RepID=A0A7R9M2W1_9ACAR|nr:unnamed protein product [Oppiella nova]CAG2169781.1 unnamed protein product [Oppiella nova]